MEYRLRESSFSTASLVTVEPILRLEGHLGD